MFNLNSTAPQVHIGDLKEKRQQKSVPLEISCNYFGVVEGYDHPTYYQLVVDGQQYFISDTLPQTQSQPFTVLVPKGCHRMRLSSFCFYHDRREEQLQSNGYSIDAAIIEKRRFRSLNQLTVQCFIVHELVLSHWEE